MESSISKWKWCLYDWETEPKQVLKIQEICMNKEHRCSSPYSCHTASCISGFIESSLWPVDLGFVYKWSCRIGWPYSKVGGCSTRAPLEGGPAGSVKETPHCGQNPSRGSCGLLCLKREVARGTYIN